MAVFHDEVEIEDFQYDEDSETYFYPCPCGDNFCITKVTTECYCAPPRSRRVSALWCSFRRSVAVRHRIPSSSCF
nr:DPH3 homolog [Manis javanica]